MPWRRNRDSWGRELQAGLTELVGAGERILPSGSVAEAERMSPGELGKRRSLPGGWNSICKAF